MQSKREEGHRVPLSIRVPPVLYDQLVARAAGMSRSLTREAEVLLEQALFAERAMGGPAWRIGLEVIRAFTGRDLSEPVEYMDAFIAAVEALADRFPAEPSPDFPSRDAQVEVAIRTALELVRRKSTERAQ